MSSPSMAIIVIIIMSGEKQFQFKVYFDARDSIRRCSFQKNLPTFAEFLACCRELFTDEFTGGERYRFAYLDDENDWIAIASEMEWQAMLSFFFPKVDDKPQPIKVPPRFCLSQKNSRIICRVVNLCIILIWHGGWWSPLEPLARSFSTSTFYSEADCFVHVVIISNYVCRST